MSLSPPGYVVTPHLELSKATDGEQFPGRRHTLAGSEALAGLDDAARQTLAARAAGEAVAAMLRRHPGEVPRRLAEAERNKVWAAAILRL